MIDFGPNQRWAAMSTLHLERLSLGEHGGGKPLRVYFAALARITPAGFAAFAPRELRSILGRWDEYGVIREPAGRQVVQNALTGAKDAGLILPESGALRVWIPDSQAQVSPMGGAGRPRKGG